MVNDHICWNTTNKKPTCFYIECIVKHQKKRLLQDSTPCHTQSPLHTHGHSQSAMHAGLQLQPVCAKQQCLPAWGAQPSGSILLTKSQGHMASCCISSHHAKALEVCCITLFAVASLQQACHDEAPSPVPMGALPFFPRVNYYSHSNCCPDANLITPVESCTGVLFGSSPVTGLSPPPTYPLSPSLLPHRLFILRQIWTNFSCSHLVAQRSLQVDSNALKGNDRSWSSDDKMIPNGGSVLAWNARRNISNICWISFTYPFVKEKTGNVWKWGALERWLDKLFFHHINQTRLFITFVVVKECRDPGGKNVLIIEQNFPSHLHSGKQPKICGGSSK